LLWGSIATNLGGGRESNQPHLFWLTNAAGD
jgi:hypothetical protein